MRKVRKYKNLFNGFILEKNNMQRILTEAAQIIVLAVLIGTPIALWYVGAA